MSSDVAHDEPPTVLVAGVGNVFLGDDGWGCEVARQLQHEELPTHVRVTDYGIGGIHLVYDLLDGVGLLVLVDATPRGRDPGTVSLLDVDHARLPDVPVDSHAMDPVAVLANVRTLGGRPPPTLVVGCEPSAVEEGIGLSSVVRDAVAPAIGLIRRAIDERRRALGAAAV